MAGLVLRAAEEDACMLHGMHGLRLVKHMLISCEWVGTCSS